MHSPRSEGRETDREKPISYWLCRTNSNFCRTNSYFPKGEVFVRHFFCIVVLSQYILSIYRLASLVVRFAPPFRLLINQLSCLLGACAARSCVRSSLPSLWNIILEGRRFFTLTVVRGSRLFSGLGDPPCASLFESMSTSVHLLPHSQFQGFSSAFCWSNWFSFPRVSLEPNPVFRMLTHSPQARWQVWPAAPLVCFSGSLV